MSADNPLFVWFSLFFLAPPRKIEKSAFVAPATATEPQPCHPDESEQFPFIEKRKHERRPCGMTIRYSILSPGGTIEESGLLASVLDVSDGGMGILTDYPLEPGRILWLDYGAGGKTGIVQWKMDFLLQNTHRLGIRFL